MFIWFISFPNFKIGYYRKIHSFSSNIMKLGQYFHLISKVVLSKMVLHWKNQVWIAQKGMDHYGPHPIFGFTSQQMVMLLSKLVPDKIFDFLISIYMFFFLFVFDWLFNSKVLEGILIHFCLKFLLLFKSVFMNLWMQC